MTGPYVMDLRYCDAQPLILYAESRFCATSTGSLQRSVKAENEQKVGVINWLMRPCMNLNVAWLLFYKIND